MGRKTLPRNRRYECGTRASSFVGKLRSLNKEVSYTREQFSDWLFNAGFPLITCPYCSTKTEFPYQVCIDHILPRIKGGSDDYSNLQLICSDCSKRKGCHTHINLILWANTVYTNFKHEIEAELKEREQSRELFINLPHKETHGREHTRDIQVSD